MKERMTMRSDEAQASGCDAPLSRNCECGASECAAECEVELRDFAGAKTGIGGGRKQSRAELRRVGKRCKRRQPYRRRTAIIDSYECRADAVVRRPGHQADRMMLFAREAQANFF